MKGLLPVDTRIVTALLLAGFMAAAAGCQSSDSGDGLDPGTEAKQAPEGKVLQSELRAYCPQVTLREGAAFFSTFEKNASDDPTKLIHQSSITAVTRKCSYAAGSMTMDVAVAGRVVPGPLAKDGTVTLPIRIAVTQGGTQLYSNTGKLQVSVNRAGGATQFVYNDPNVTFPTPSAGAVQVYAGFDTGPAKKGSPAGDQTEEF